MVEVSRRSTLELLLDSIKEQNEAPPDNPPALPHRPTSRGRLPSTARMRKTSFGTAAVVSRNESSAKLLDDSLETSTSNLRQSTQYTRQSNGEKVDTEDLDYGLVPQNYTGSELRGHLINTANVAHRNRAGTPTIPVYAVEKEAGRMINVRTGDDGLVRGSADSKGRVRDENGSATDHILEPGSTRSADSHIYLQHSITNQDDAFINRRKRREDRPSGLRKDSRVWCLNSDSKWMRSIIQSIDNREAVLKTADGQLRRVSSNELLSANPEILDGVDDLVQLSYIHKPAISHNLQIRYAQDNIYTSAGSMLIAVNPFKEVQLGTIDSFKAYNRKSKIGSGPHVFKVAENAHKAMMKDGVNQSIIISGESGAGKTEAARLTMQYLVANGGAERIGNVIVQANKVLEAFGNARTLGNKNGSRFGKVVDINFKDSGELCGAKFQVGFLDKSRIVNRVEGECSFHIFYQLCEGADPSLREHLNLRSAKEFQYLNQSRCLGIDDIDCKAQFHSLRNAMDTLGITEEEQESIFAMLAGVLWLGNVISPVLDNDNELCTHFAEAVHNSAKVLKCSKEQLLGALRMSKYSPTQLEVMPQCTNSQVLYARDALAKSIYEGLFEWLLDRINKSLEVEKGVNFKCISILDNPGFESSKKNGLEQLYINYSNELIRHYIHGRLFQEEEEECIYDGIYCGTTPFPDNEKCIELFEKGIFPSLDAECASAEGTDCSFIKNLRDQLGDDAYYTKMENPQFGICHDTREVTYDATDFLMINRDLLSHDISQVSSLCLNQLKSCPHYKSICLEGSLWLQKQSLVSRWKNQLLQVMHQLDNTAQHFILCIKPNKLQSPASYEQDLVMQQLHSYGVLEVVKAARSGFSTRLLHHLFANRFGLLLSRNVVENQDVVGRCVAVLQQCSIPPQMYRVGSTKIFLHAGQIDKLEHTREKFLQRIISLQNVYRGYKLRCNFTKKKRTVVLLQAWVRGWLVRKGYRSIQEENTKTSVADQKLSKTRPISEELDAFCSEIDLRGHIRDENGSSEVSYTGLQRDKDCKTLTPAVGAMGSQVSVAETLRERENENALLQQSLQEYKRRWSEYEIKMKSMEEMWQKQIASLQCSLSAGKKNMCSDDYGNDTLKQSDLQNIVAKQQGSQDTRIHVTNTGNMKTSPHKPPHCIDLSVNRGELDPSRSVLDHLAKEFEHRTQVFNDDVDFLVEVKSGQTEANFKPDDELKKLKLRFDIWKKDFKIRIRETKGILKKLGKSEPADRNRKNWWGKKSI